MCNNLITSDNTILLKVQESVGDVQASLKYLTESTSCESGTLGQISCLLNVLSVTLRSAYSDLALMIIESEKEKQLALAANVELQAKITEDAPKVAFAESVNRTVDNLSVRDYAKILYDENIKLGEKRLFHLLRQKKVLDGNNKPKLFSIGAM